MIYALAFSIANLPSAERERLAVYALAGILGLLATGLLFCLRDLKHNAEQRRLEQARDAEEAARRNLQGFLRSRGRA